MQIPILEGRDFDDRDQPKTQRAVIVNQRMAEMLWPGESAVGKRIFIGTESRDAWEVVGVVKTGKYRTLAEDPKPFFYYSMGQRRPGTMAMVVRASIDPRSLVGAIRSEVQSIDRRVPLSGVKTMDEHKTYLQRDGLRRVPTHARGRHSYGARRKPRRCDEDDHATGNASRGGWCRHRFVAIAGARTGVVVVVDRYQRLRHNDVRSRTGAVVGGGAGCVLFAGAKGDESGSTRRTKVRVKPQKGTKGTKWIL
jgi:hypothetical protein